MNWRNLSVGQEKYVRFSPTCDFSGFLGDKGMGRKVILDDAGHDVPTPNLGAPTGSIMEVEEAVAVDENEAGTNSPAKEESEDVEMDTDADAEASASPKRERTASPSPTPRKRRRSGNAKPDIPEKTDSATPKKPALTGRRTHSLFEVVVPPRPGRVSPKKGEASTSAKKPASRRVMVPESPVATRKPSPVKAKTPAKKSLPAEEDEEESEDSDEDEPAPTKPSPRKKVQKRKRYESESEDEGERPTPGPSKSKPAQRPTIESSPPPVRANEAPIRGRRSAAQKADEKLKDIMPDVINFEKQMKRGVVVGEWERRAKEQEKADKTKEKEKEKEKSREKEKEKSKENSKEKAKEPAKRRRSDIRYDSSVDNSPHPNLTASATALKKPRRRMATDGRPPSAQELMCTS